MLKHKKLTIIIFAVFIVLLVSAIVLVFVLPNRETPLEDVEIPADSNAGYAQIADGISKDDVDALLSDYTQGKDGDLVTYQKGDILITIQYDENGKVIYRRYEYTNTDNAKIALDGFNESQLAIGMEQAEALKLFADKQYVYHLFTHENGEALELYYYGWLKDQPQLKLIFRDGVLTGYTIGNLDLEEPVTVDIGV